MIYFFIIDNGKTIGGGDYAQFKFAEGLVMLGHEVTIFAANYNSFFSELKTLPKFRIIIRNELPRTVKGFGLLNSIWDFLFTKIEVERQIRKNKPDYIIGYLRNSAIKAVNLGKKYKIKTVNFIFENPEWMKRTLGDRFLEEYNGKFKDSWVKTKLAYLETDILFPNSKLTRKECETWLNKKVEKPIYPGIEIPEINVGKENQIIYVGRLNAYKNIDLIIKALSTIKNAPKFVIVGTGEEETSLKKLASELNVNAEFKGSLNDTDKFKEIKKSLFMVFPSSFEGFGMPPGEALASGIPCICSDIPILKEIYADKVEYFKEHDVDDLAKQIQNLIKKPAYCKKRGIEGNKYIKEKYSWEKSAKRIDEILMVRQIV
ncbi:MAG: glycosyltransferase family 4 protein [archaeon]